MRSKESHLYYTCTQVRCTMAPNWSDNKGPGHQTGSEVFVMRSNDQSPLFARGKTERPGDCRAVGSSSSLCSGTPGGGGATLPRLWPLLSVLSTMNRLERVERKIMTLANPDKLKIHSAVRVAAEGRCLGEVPKPPTQRRTVSGMIRMLYTTG